MVELHAIERPHLQAPVAHADVSVARPLPVVAREEVVLDLLKKAALTTPTATMKRI